MATLFFFSSERARLMLLFGTREPARARLRTPTAQERSFLKRRESDQTLSQRLALNDRRQTREKNAKDDLSREKALACARVKSALAAGVGGMRAAQTCAPAPPPFTTRHVRVSTSMAAQALSLSRFFAFDDL